MKRFKLWCLICGGKIEMPSDVIIDEDVTIYDTILWANHNLGCKICFYLPNYGEIRVGVKEIEEPSQKSKTL